MSLKVSPSGNFTFPLAPLQSLSSMDSVFCFSLSNPIHGFVFQQYEAQKLVQL